MDHMNPLDAAFWELEDGAAALHIASVALFEGPAPSLAAIRRLYSRKLCRVPRMRQRMRPVLLDLARPVWVDDTHFELARHVRRAAVPAPGGLPQLASLMGRLMSTHLDPERPLWQAWLVDGLAHGQWAIVTKLHHSMVDGVAGIAVLEHILDDSPDAPLPRPDHWAPRPEPAAAVLVVDALGELAAEQGRALVTLARAAGGAVTHPRTATRRAAGLAEGVARFVAAVVPGPPTRLSGPLSAPRRFRTVSADIADVALVRSRFGGSLNDVVLAMVTTGLRDLLVEHERLVPHLVRCLVPVSVRAPEAGGAVDNRVSALLADLPVEFGDPLSRYGAVLARTRRLKASHEAEAGSWLTDTAHYLPPPLLTAALHVAFRVPHRTVITVVTNVPGPPGELYALGRRMVANYPYVPIANRVRLGVAVTSYAGRLYFGVTSDRAALPDVDLVCAGIRRGLAELLEAAGPESAAPLPREA